MPSFAQDIRPLFRDKDIAEMRFAFDLSQYDEVRTNAQGIYERLAGGDMPCDGAWAEDRIVLFHQWMEEDCPP
jgi:hypothetical protein